MCQVLYRVRVSCRFMICQRIESVRKWNWKTFSNRWHTLLSELPWKNLYRSPGQSLTLSLDASVWTPMEALHPQISVKTENFFKYSFYLLDKKKLDNFVRKWAYISGQPLDGFVREDQILLGFKKISIFTLVCCFNYFGFGMLSTVYYTQGRLYSLKFYERSVL